VAAVQAKDLVREAATHYIENKITFLDTAVHELRNPANSISLLLQFAEKQVARGQPLNPDFLKRFRPPIDRLIKLVVDLIDISRLERKLVALVPVKTNMVSLISQCLEEFRMQAPDCSFTFNQPDQVVEVNTDPIRINQVLTNLLDNAVKYAPGPIEVTLQIMPDLIRVEVTDHGPGVPEEQEKLLFSAFHRGTSEATVKASGLGLGLSICREIIKLHQGTIGYVSEENKGNTFYFELPNSLPLVD
jgi:signal transduction histidine kinase